MGTPKQHDIKTLESIISNENSVIEKIDERILIYIQRRNRLLGSSKTDNIKSGLEEEYSFLSQSISDCQTNIKPQLVELHTKLNTPLTKFKRLKVSADTGKELQSRENRRVKENGRKKERAKEKGLEERWKEIFIGMFGEEEGTELFQKLNANSTTDEEDYQPTDPFWKINKKV